VVVVDALDGLLLSPDQIGTAMGATAMTVTVTPTVMYDDSAEVADKACLPLASGAEAPVYAGSGWSAFREQALHDAGATFTHTAIQSVVLFSSAHDADAFFTASAQSWPACSNRQYTHTAAGKTQVLTVGPVSTTNGTLSATITGGKGLTGFCERALAVANNVAIDVDACSHGQSDAAVTIAGQIAAKVPTT
jgi:serine/threonine-protein kinase